MRSKNQRADVQFFFFFYVYCMMSNIFAIKICYTCYTFDIFNGSVCCCFNAFNIINDVLQVAAMESRLHIYGKKREKYCKKPLKLDQISDKEAKFI